MKAWSDVLRFALAVSVAGCGISGALSLRGNGGSLPPGDAGEVPDSGGPTFQDGGADAGRPDAGSDGGGDAGRFDAGEDAGDGGDAGTALGPDAGDAGTRLDAGASPYGDRNETVNVAYPAGALVQNGGRVIDVRNPPPGLNIAAAAGDGVTDDTAALTDAYDFLKNAFLDGGGWAQPYWVYLPSGTYLVSDTIIYRGGTLETNPQGYVWFDVTGVRIIGQERSSTVLKLADGAAGFQDKANPKILLSFDHPATVFNNIPGNNVLENLTLDVGSGNPGAVGLQFQGANETGMRNVEVTADDGQGAIGIWFRMGSVQGNYRDITVKGFDTGIETSAQGEMSPSFEHVTLSGQHTVGALILAGSLGLRAAAIDERATAATGLEVNRQGGQGVIFDSELQGSAKAVGIELTSATGQALFARNVLLTGFGTPVSNAGAAVPVTAGRLDEWVSQPAVSLFPGQPLQSFTVPERETPNVPWFDPQVDWANVGDFGALGDGTTDDTAAVQAALNSGKAVVYFPKTAYSVGALDIPASVQRLEVMYAQMHPTYNITHPSGAPLLIRGTTDYGSAVVSAARDVVLELWSGGFVNQSTAPATLFLENGANVGAGDGFAPAGQTVYARSLNDENGSGTGDVRVNGGTLWMFNYKTENKPDPTLSAVNGAVVQSFGGYTNIAAPTSGTPLISNVDSNVSFVGSSNLFCGSDAEVAISETRGGVTQTLAPAALPSRGSNNGQDGCWMIPLYVGYDPSAVP